VGQGGAEIDRSSHPAAWFKRGRASSGCFLSKKTKAAAACSPARAERLALRRCQSFSGMARRAARAWASSTVLSSLRLTVWVVCVVSSIIGNYTDLAAVSEFKKYTAYNNNLIGNRFFLLLSGLQIEMPQQPSELNREEQESEFVEAIAAVERSLAAVKERYTQIQVDRQRQVELGHRREDVRQSVRQNPLPQLKKELREIEQELETIELNLESSLFSWGSIKQPFWQAVRFGGLGILLGWILKSYAG